VTQIPDENDPAIPTLTRRVGSACATPLQSAQPPATETAPVPALSCALLQTLLQAEIERAVNRAIGEAANSVRLHLEQEIPAIVERTLRRVNGQASARS